jgi:hypothetical protein
MTDPMLRPEPLIPLAVVPGQVQQALADVRARRRRSALTATALSVAVLTAVGAGVSGTARRDSLDVVPAGPLPVASATPVPDGGGAPAAALAAHGDAGRPDAPAPTSTPGLPVIGRPRPESSTQPAASPRPGYRRRPQVTREVEQTYVDAEQGKGGLHSGGCVAAAWCASVTAERSAGAIVFRVVVCRDNTVPDSRLFFDADDEIDVIVRADGDQGREVWRWSAGQRFREREHDVAVPSGACAVWSMTWDAVLDSGDDLPSGDYVVTGRSRSAELASAEPEYSLTVP